MDFIQYKWEKCAWIQEIMFLMGRLKEIYVKRFEGTADVRGAVAA